MTSHYEHALYGRRLAYVRQATSQRDSLGYISNLDCAVVTGLIHLFTRQACVTLHYALRLHLHVGEDS
jgi:hypothetical protein